MIDIKDKTQCTACSACINICPKGAINFQKDNEGYAYPVVDKNKCVNCNLCDKICPLKNELDNKNYEEPYVYASWNKDEEIRIESTSGGVFSALATDFLNNNGIVVGAEYTDDFTIKHTFINSLEHLKKIRQSKYAQSELGDVFSEIKRLLMNNEKVMFCGTPCQVAGLKSYLRKEYDNLLLVDFICRGIISQKVYKKYLSSVEQHKNAKIVKVHFKNKDFGWNRFSTKLSLNSDETYHKDRYNDEYMVGYLKHNLYIRPSCHECKFKSMPRVADITLGDFWGIAKKDPSLDNDKGTSVVLVNSKKGENYFNAIKDNYLISNERKLEDVIAGNSCLFNVAPEGKYRDYFFKKFEKTDFIDLVHKIDEKAIRDTYSLKEKLYYFKTKVFK